MSTLIKGARPYGEGDPVDVLVEDGVITGIGAVDVPEDVEVIEASGQVLLPGFVDLHTHLREPGREDTETIDSGSAAAALGGYTAVFAMANTDPVADNAVIVEHVWRRGQEVGLVDVHPVGAVTVGLKGEKLAELGTMAKSQAQVKVFSDDGLCVADPLLMRRALEYSTALDVVIAQHAEEPRLTVGAQAHEGEQAARLGYPGWPASAEESIVARDCLLALHAKARLHVCHVSTSGTADVLRWAKERGTKVSAEVTPHHLLLTDERLTTYDPINKVNPPLRTESDAEKLRAALAEGVIDCVATDHAPHAVQDKDCEWSAARPGMLGLQTALSIVAETMVRTGLLDWRGVARVMSERPAEIGNLPDHGRPIAVGEPANLTLVDPDAEWTVRGAELASIAANTPYEGMRLPGVVTATLLRGRITARDGKISLMERLWLVLAIVAFFLLCLGGMYLGWRRKSRSQSVLVPPFPEIPASPGEALLESTGVYLSTTTAGNWQDRIVTRGAGLRTNAAWKLYDGGVAVERGGAPDFWIPRDAVTGVRRDNKIAGKVMGTDALLILTWRLGDVELDTGFRGDDLDDYPKWTEHLKIKGGAQ